MKNVILMLIVFFVVSMVSCSPESSEMSFKNSFIVLTCDIYEQEECGFSESDRDFCEEFVDAAYYNGYLNGKDPVNPDACLSCFKDLGCDAWSQGHLCQEICSVPE